jgi:nucleoid DNA-binding protein
VATRRDMARQLARELGITVSLAREVIDLFLDEIASELIHSGRVEFRGFGSFKVEKRKAKRVRHPKTGEWVQIPARKEVEFRAGQELHAALND